MGWYADTAWDITIRTSVADLCNAVADALETIDPDRTRDDVSALRDHADLSYLTGQFNETSDVRITDTGFTAWGSGKAYSPGEPPLFNPGSKCNQGGFDLYTVMAQHCMGTIDWLSTDEDHRWRVRFPGDGTWSEYAAAGAVFLGDPGEDRVVMDAGITRDLTLALQAGDPGEVYAVAALLVLSLTPDQDLLTALADHPDPRVREQVTHIVTHAAA